jgi:hypothetical protein
MWTGICLLTTLSLFQREDCFEGIYTVYPVRGIQTTTSMYRVHQYLINQIIVVKAIMWVAEMLMRLVTCVHLCLNWQKARRGYQLRYWRFLCQLKGIVWDVNSTCETVLS